jgi:hypothetical protein
VTAAVVDRTGRTGLLLVAPLVVLGVAAGRLPLGPVVLLAALLGALAAVVAYRYPTRAVLVATAVVTVVPFYDGRYVIGAVGLSPVGAACLVLAPAAFDARRRVRLGSVDVAVASLVFLRCASAAVNAARPLGAALNVLLSSALPYAVFRCLTVSADMPRRLAGAVVTAAVPLAAIGVAERNGFPNPFFTLVRPELEAAQWARPEVRSGGVRAEASFGSPIAFGMFLALAFLLAVVLALSVHALLPRVLLLAASGLLLLALTATLSRGPLLVAAVALAVWLLMHALRVDTVRVGVLALVVGAFVVATPVLGTLQNLQRASTGDTAEARSAEYRFQVLDVVRDPAQFSLLGKPAVGGPVSQAVGSRTGLKSIDSEFAVVHLTYGVLALLAFVAVGLLVVRTAFTRGLGAVDSAWAVGLAVSFVNLLTVALLTQYEELFWGFTAVVAGIAQRRRVQS